MSNIYSLIIDTLQRHKSLSSYVLAGRVGKEEWEIESYLEALAASHAITLHREENGKTIAALRFPRKNEENTRWTN